MPIIGKLIKKTNEISYKRNLKVKNDKTSQSETLTALLLKAKNTAIGKQYAFSESTESEDVIEAFQKKVPIQDYDAFYTNWLKKTIEGEVDWTWPGRVKHFALSSGTTGSPSKRIPVTIQMIRNFQKASIKQLSILHELELDDSFFSAQVLAVGGSTKLTKTKTHIEGDLSGILKKYTSFVATPFTKPERKISKIPDWNTKLELMVEKAPSWNIGIVAGVPSWCILLMEKIIERYELDSIHDIWPNFKVYVHGGVFMNPYMDRIQKVIGHPIHTLDTYLASEGYFAYQKNPNKEGMQLLLNNGIFFEFIPFNSDYFDQNGSLINPHHAFSIDEVQPGIDYALVVTTNAGLWRYLIGDLVRFTDIEQREVVITGRIKQFLSICGEHLSLDNINKAIELTSEELNMDILEFTIAENGEQLQHHWYIGSNSKVDREKVMATIDGHIKALNDDYASARKINLKTPEITLLPTDKFYEFLSEQGKSGAQNKFPRVLNKEQKEKWLSFLSC